MNGFPSQTKTERKSKSRVASKPLNGRGARMPSFDHPALMEGRTIFPSTIRKASEVGRALKSGFNSAKIGAVVRKGRWRGFPVYSLTLEERATCPSSCRHWRSCYGNNSHLAERLAHGPDLEWRLERELAALELSHPEGFAVRLHVLGDFYEVGYVEFWARMLERHEALHVFGYSARFDYEGDPIARALIDLVRARWERFAVRFSNGPVHRPATISVEHPYQLPADAVLCPAQVGKSESCTTCALCWQTKRRIGFLQH